MPEKSWPKLARQSRPRVFEYVEHVARVGSIRKAAETLNIASSAINRLILIYERELGTALFERLPRGVRLTSAGELMLAHIRRSAKDFELVSSQIDSLRGTQRGHVRIAAIEAIASTLLAEQLARFVAEHPHVSFEVEVLGSTEVVDSVLRDETDLGLALNPPATRRFSRLCTVRHALHAFVSSEHPLARRRWLRLADCVGYRIALGSETLGGRRLLDHAQAESSIRLQPFLVSNSIATMMSVAERSEAICFQVLAEPRRRAEGRLVAIPISDPGLSEIDLVLGANQQRTLSVAAAVFANQLESAMRKSASRTPH